MPSYHHPALTHLVLVALHRRLDDRRGRARGELDLLARLGRGPATLRDIVRGGGRKADRGERCVVVRGGLRCGAEAGAATEDKHRLGSVRGVVVVLVREAVVNCVDYCGRDETLDVRGGR